MTTVTPDMTRRVPSTAGETVATWSIVIPATRPHMVSRLVAALDDAGLPAGVRVIVVDDRSSPATPITGRETSRTVDVLRGGGQGPAAARNTGARACTTDWVVFLDDDVIPQPGWSAALAQDLHTAGPEVAAVQGRVRVPRPPGRRPTDWERSVIGLERARWITADMAILRQVLNEIGGFDECFPRAYREDTDAALRLTDVGYRVVPGRREVIHPIGQASALVSVRRQVGNRDDALMRARHGREWRRRAGVPLGRLPTHVATTSAAAIAAVAAIMRRPGVAVAAMVVCGAGLGEFALARIRPGPRTVREVATMLGTSVLIPPVAVMQRIAGEAGVRLGRRGFDRSGAGNGPVPQRFAEAR